MRIIGIILMATIFASTAYAGEADVVGVDVRKESAGTYRFDVAVKHADEGWDHYADAWEVLGADGTIIAVRVLAHPHVNEQPFTRTLSGVKIPEGIDTVTIRAKDSVHGYGGKEISVVLP
ncbi:hypothetical protein [Pseudovibrio sp. Tun.PSC04-5.I4]|uniref:hypothetical protein n=1 Tax=Pseudovibrio sp. Tun.PSC04-5.I4 TaxID=1798213 RepID=UPI00088501BC|nr:hypothetical protein [Pseudovibrio sp. Tun.PSC04-5.I4]SDR33299.1 hypothetical protein SAMN04515695_4596 [Pseudovibrio sp. Tun.PSC04-5.I4]